MGLGPIIVESNDDLLLTLTYFMTMSNLVSGALKLGPFICIIHQTKTCNNKAK